MNGRVAAVLGVGPGLGAAVARRFAREGFAVALMARREESVAGVREGIEGEGGTAVPVTADAALGFVLLSPSVKGLIFRLLR